MRSRLFRARVAMPPVLSAALPVPPRAGRRAELSTMMRKFVDDVMAGRHESEGWPNSCYITSKIAVIAYTNVRPRRSRPVASSRVAAHRGVRVRAASVLAAVTCVSARAGTKPGLDREESVATSSHGPSGHRPGVHCGRLPSLWSMLSLRFSRCPLRPLCPRRRVPHARTPVRHVCFLAMKYIG